NGGRQVARSETESVDKPSRQVREREKGGDEGTSFEATIEDVDRAASKAPSTTATVAPAEWNAILAVGQTGIDHARKPDGGKTANRNLPLSDTQDRHAVVKLLRQESATALLLAKQRFLAADIAEQRAGAINPEELASQI